VNSCTNSPEDGPVDPKLVEIQQYTNKIVTSVGFHSICGVYCSSSEWEQERNYSQHGNEISGFTKTREFLD